MRGHAHFIGKGSNTLMVFGTMNITFLSWDEAQIKFHLTEVDNEDWITLTSKIIDKWRHLLEVDLEAIHTGPWVGFYCEGKGDMTFVLHCTKDFIPSSRQQYHLTLPLKVKCLTVGTHSRCLSEWWKPSGEFTGFIHQGKIVHTMK